MLLFIIFFTLLVCGESRLAEDVMNNKEESSAPRDSVREQTVSAPFPVSSTGCFHVDRIHCPKPPESCVSFDNAMLCCDVDSVRIKEGLSSDLSSGNTKIQMLHVLNATLDKLDVSQVTWKTLTSISFTDGNIKQIVGEFTKYSSATCLNISNNGIANITQRALVNLIKLTKLDLSGNELTDLPNFSKLQQNFSIDIKGNKEMFCKKVTEALEQHRGLIFVNLNTTFCATSQTFRWFNSTELVPIVQMVQLHELKDDCSEARLGAANCTCEPIRLDIVAGKMPTFSVKVDCSNQDLKKLPLKLPPNTIELNVSYNRITSLVNFSDPSYEHLRYFYADNNTINNIVELEGTKFMENFIMLSLKSNKIKSLPTYILSDAFDKNWRSRYVKLGYNELLCDCYSAKVLKHWLLAKTVNIPDYKQLYCENTPGKLIDLPESKFCQQQRDWTDYIYYIITAEVLLLLGLIFKVSYDYWIFKTAGYLPWPASKMPKLPCDWLCE